MSRWSLRRVAMLPGAIAAAAVILAACGSGTSSNEHNPTRTQRVAGGVAYFAEDAGAKPNYIFPLDSSAYFTIENTSLFQFLMYRPLYWFGIGSKTGINYQLSLANPPVFSDGDRTVTITLRHYMWSDGEPVSSRDVIFWMNLLRANRTSWAAYVPGAFPDNVVSYSAPNANTVVFHLNSAYNPTWFTYNELSQITPLPIAWDRTSLSQPVPSPTTRGLPDTSPKGARAVYNFLNSQALDLATYATSPIWSVVDGPWRLRSFTTAGRAVFVPNRRYSGPVKPALSEFVELPFTSNSTEFNVLRSGNGAITYGYVPVSDLSQVEYVMFLGYSVKPWLQFAFNYWVENYHNPTYGPLFKQLYFRQAIQHLVDQPAWITHFLKGYAVPTYSPVPLAPPNPFADAASKTNPYPYSIAAARALLVAHGWRAVDGIMTCESPGSGRSECGEGVPRGLRIDLNLQYASGTDALAEEMEAFASAARQAGIEINLSEAPFDTVLNNAVPCSPSQAACKWEMENWGIGWEYSPDNYPTGGELFSTGAGSNFGSYSSKVANALIAASHTSPNGQAALDAYQNYMVHQLPVIYAPSPDYAVAAILKTLHGATFNPYVNIEPEEWYFVR
jgi:peptide/nickel transport system substrate-binding protein